MESSLINLEVGERERETASLNGERESEEGARPIFFAAFSRS